MKFLKVWTSDNSNFTINKYENTALLSQVMVPWPQKLQNKTKQDKPPMVPIPKQYNSLVWMRLSNMTYVHQSG